MCGLKRNGSARCVGAGKKSDGKQAVHQVLRSIVLALWRAGGDSGARGLGVWGLRLVAVQRLTSCLSSVCWHRSQRRTTGWSAVCAGDGAGWINDPRIDKLETAWSKYTVALYYVCVAWLSQGFVFLN